MSAQRLRSRMQGLTGLTAAACLAGTLALSAGPGPQEEDGDPTPEQNAAKLIQAGRKTFRFDTFGDEAFWGGQLMLHKAIAGMANGGVGPGLSPTQALALGLKVDADALPGDLKQMIASGKLNLEDPANTVALLELNAVVGVTGFLSKETGQLEAVGIQCALCHSTVDDSFAPGIGKRLDGWANRDLDVGKIVSLSPNLSPIADLLGVPVPTVVQVLESWGPGKFDAQLFLDGKAFTPSGKSAATLIPPAFALPGFNLHTSTGWGSVTYWNAFVANIEMHGKGTFYDPRLNDPVQFPIAAKAGFGNITNEPDLVTPKLPALHLYQLSLAAPQPPPGSFDPVAAKRGAILFEGKAQCSRCHVEGLYTEPGWNLHTGAEIGIDEFQAQRSPDKRYRTAPLRGLWTHQKGGFYHDGRFATLDDVVGHYDQHFALQLSVQERHQLVQFLLSL